MRLWARLASSAAGIRCVWVMHAEQQSIQNYLLKANLELNLISLAKAKTKAQSVSLCSQLITYSSCFYCDFTSFKRYMTHLEPYNCNYNWHLSWRRLHNLLAFLLSFASGVSPGPTIRNTKLFCVWLWTSKSVRHNDDKAWQKQLLLPTLISAPAPETATTAES